MRDATRRLDKLEVIWPTTPACPICTSTGRVLLVGGTTPPEPDQRCPACCRPWRTVVYMGGVDVSRI